MFLICRSAERSRSLARVVGPFDAVVAAVVVVVAVAVALAVGLVVLPVVAHQVVEREAVVRGDEVDAVVRAAGRSAWYRSLEPARRVASGPIMPGSPRQKRRTSSR